MTLFDDVRSIIDEVMGGDPLNDADEGPIGVDRAAELVHQYHRLGEDIAEAADMYQRAIDKLVDARNGHLEPLEAERDHIETVLRLWHAARYAEDGKATIKLPTGTLSSSKAQDAWTYHDESAFITWAKDNAPDALRQPEPPPIQVAKTEARKSLEALIAINDDGTVVDRSTGEIVPGLRVTPGGYRGRHYHVK
ncbi:host-nuclease inhibitor Gam family protein [Desertimonas flava]|uniref:host-nuclease inhibitor Gam family protein n=1 Tax=Desertimonas flava TaxID=2064846 RepID=UPI000E342C1A|nr:host-nuclease inhibitor Gam family protein [Desertimonas flava]